METNLIQQLTSTFEGHAQQTENGIEYWLASDLQQLLGYAEWRNFNQTAISKAKIACEVSGHRPADHFVGVNRMVEIGSGTQREIEDIMLTRYACYLIAQNGDPRKQEIAFAQTRRAADPPQPRHPPGEPASRRGCEESGTPPDLRRKERHEEPRHLGRRMKDFSAYEQ